MTTPIADILERAATRVEKPGAWTQGAYARAASGIPLEAADVLNGTSWCVLGACRAEGAEKDDDVAYWLLDTLHLLKREWAHGWNDTAGRTQAEAVGALRRAAARAREAGK